MSDRTTSSSGADTDDSSGDEGDDTLEPGGGPDRVVSDQSVDDILDSLESTADGDPGAVDSGSVSDETTDPTDAQRADTSTDEETAPGDGDAGTDDPADDASDAATDDGDRATADGDRIIDASADDSSSVSSEDDSAEVPTDDASLEELAARVEEGSVTGADVRAAESGDGRESTTDVGDLDLSVDDLETDDGVADADGPLAGSLEGGGESGDDEPEDDSPGLVGRILGLFGR